MEVGFKGYHPVANLIFFASVVTFAMLFKHPATVAVCFVAMLCYYVRLSKKSAVKNILAFLLPMLLFVTAINGLFAHYGTTPILTLPDGNKMTLEAIVYGFVLGVVTVTVIMCFFCYNEVVTADKFMCVFGKLLPTWTLVVSMALRFVPMYSKRLKTISEAQRGIGKDYRQGSLIEKIKNAGSIISVLITWSFENAIDTADSMRARGYGIRGRKSYGKFRWSRRDYTCVAVMLVFDTILTHACVKRTLYCVYNPYTIINPPADFGKTYFISELNLTLNPISDFGIITIAAFTLLCFLPLIIEIKEDVKWNRLKSKI